MPFWPSNSYVEWQTLAESRLKSRLEGLKPFYVGPESAVMPSHWCVTAEWLPRYDTAIRAECCQQGLHIDYSRALPLCRPVLRKFSESQARKLLKSGSNFGLVTGLEPQ